MKYLSFILLMIAIACTKSTSKNNNNDNPLTGKWIQIAYLSDPGDGNGTWQQDDTRNTYIVFNEDSSAESGGIPYFGELKSYHITSDSTLTLEYENGAIFPRMYNINNDTLSLMGGCIEACESKYIKAPTM